MMRNNFISVSRNNGDFGLEGVSTAKISQTEYLSSNVDISFSGLDKKVIFNQQASKDQNFWSMYEFKKSNTNAI